MNGVSLKDRHNISKKTILTRKITDEKKELFRTKLENTDWTEVLMEPNCNSKWEKLTNKIQTALDEKCPCIEKTVSIGAKLSKTPWITEGLRNSEQTLSKLMKKAYNRPNITEDGQTLNN